MMKKIYIFTAALLATVTISAQRSSTIASTNFYTQGSSLERSSIDTIAPSCAFSSAATYQCTGPGFVVGPNFYGDKQKVQIFYPTDVSSTPVPFTVIGAIYWFGAKGVGAAPGTVKYRTYQIDGTGAAQAGPTACPNTVVVSDNVSMSAIDTNMMLSGITPYNFSAPSQFTTLNPDGYYSFGVGFDVTLVNTAGGDSLGLVSTVDGDDSPAMGFPVASWEQWSDNAWHSFEEDNNWDLAIDLAIFPIGFNTAGIEDSYVNGVSVGAVSPFTGAGKFTYGVLNNVNKATINIVDMRGSVLYTKELGNVAAGSYTLDYDASALTAGTYFIMFQADKGRMAAKFVKQ